MLLNKVGILNGPTSIPHLKSAQTALGVIIFATLVIKDINVSHTLRDKLRQRRQLMTSADEM
ncbi:hypothetical protein [Thorsellia kenyensis]|uniref:Uncharacterized protein n=1 Tax=Thorsellia kenyensis TaxID=1549888 RepID=A0ABV6CAB3_9GAMM